jgi:acetoin utilization protein AcuB
MASSVPIMLRQIMTTHVVTVSMDDGLRMVRQLFEQHGFHHLLVVEDGRLVGLISDRDLLRHVSPFVGHDLAERAQDMATLNKRAHQIMTRKPIFAHPDTTVPEAVALILDRRISCLPVVDERTRPVGVVTWRDILKILASAERQAE